MKYLNPIFVAVIILVVSCNTNENNSENAGDSTVIGVVASASPKSEIWVVDTKASEIVWKGTKPTGEHLGTIKIKEGSLSSEKNKITSGHFIIDMTSIKETTNSEKPNMQKKLVDDLKSDNFFNVHSYPVSTFAITELKGDTVFGNLTIKNITHGVKFPANIKIEGNNLNALAGFEIDRTDWDINYHSGKKLKDKLADNIIGDNIIYKVTLIAYKKQ